MGTSISSSLNAEKNLEIDSRVEQIIKHGALGGGIKFDLQVGILDWLAAFGKISGGVFLGNGLDFYKLGLGLKYDYDLGVKFRLWQNKRFMLSTAVSFLGNGFSGVVPQDIQNKILSNTLDIKTEFTECSAISSAKTKAEFNLRRKACDKIQNEIISYANELGAKFDIALVMGINKLMGIWVDAGYSHMLKEPNNLGLFTGTIYGGVTYSVNLEPATSVPLGFLVGPKFSYLIDKERANTSNIGILNLMAGIYYTGTPNFSAGIEIADELIPFLFGVVNIRAHSLNGQLGFRYFWD